MDTPHQPKQTEIIRRLVDADTIGYPLGLTGRTIRNWAADNRIPTALRMGKVLRFDPEAVAQALGLNPTDDGNKL